MLGQLDIHRSITFLRQLHQQVDKTNHNDHTTLQMIKFDTKRCVELDSAYSTQSNVVLLQTIHKT